VLLHPVKVGVWFAVSARRSVEPVFFNETVNCKRYVRVILGQFFPQLPEEERLYGWFQQDSVTACTACMSMQAFSDVFKDRIISSCIWPGHSPNLNPCDFFLWGCLKDKAYNSPAEQFQRVNQNLFRQCEECLSVEGQHFQHLLWSVNCNYFIPNVISQQAYCLKNVIFSDVALCRSCMN
jgi:hypothetical protein